MKYTKLREEEIKNKVGQDYFSALDTTQIIGNIDFCVSSKINLSNEPQSLLWAEAKKGSADVYTSLVQLILTVGKARTFDKVLPPSFLGAFDAEKMAFLPYNSIQDVFYQNDFNWNVAPSNHETKEFKQVFETVKTTIESQSLLFYFEEDDDELFSFIEENFILGSEESVKVRIDKNNFLAIYNKWYERVKPTIGVNWEAAKQNGIIDADFYLADLLSLENETLRAKLYVTLKKTHYEVDRKLSDMGMFTSYTTAFLDKQKAHNEFWNKYERPPKEEYWDYIIKRRDLLVPQDIRERKGSFFTPQIWVELSQKYLGDVLGENWQDEYYIWDCAAGTGNLLAGLTNKYRIWASTLDKQDVDVMHDRIENGANLLESHVFQFDFLNDDFSKLPEGLQKIINDPEQRKKLIIYINPPYAEASSYGTHSVPLVANETQIFGRYKDTVGAEAMSELFAQFFIRAQKEIPECTLAAFSTPKYLTSDKFQRFRNHFEAKYQKGFMIPAYSFDNVKGKFPIAFLVWTFTKASSTQSAFKIQVFEPNHTQTTYRKIATKEFSAKQKTSITSWRKSFYDFESASIGYMIIVGPSMQSNRNTFITSQPAEGYVKKKMVANITAKNLIQMAIYLAIRHSIKATWINDRDHFLTPKTSWKKDEEFHHDCLAYTLFHGQNRISAEEGTNFWIPFREQEVNSRDAFDSNFITDFIAGKIQIEGNGNLLETQKNRATPIHFSPEAIAVFEAGKDLWAYYHAQPQANPNAALYDIRLHFQGHNEKGRMNASSKDETYSKLLENLRSTLKVLAQKIEPKVYMHGFLKR